MTQTHPSIHDSSGNGTESKPSGGEQEHAGNSGEGAASALAQLKTQTKQHRRQLGDSEHPSDGASQ